MTTNSDFGSDTLANLAQAAAAESHDGTAAVVADLERARSWAVELEAQNVALIEFIRPLAGRGCARYRSSGCPAGPSGCRACHARRLLAACDGIPE